MKRFFKLGLLGFCLFFFICLTSSWFLVRWVHIKQTYPSSEFQDRLSLLPEDVHRLTLSDTSETKKLFLGYASFELPNDSYATHFLEVGVDSYSIWLQNEEVTLYFESPLAVNQTYEMEAMLEITNMTKTQWRENRLLRATDTIEKTIVGLPDFLLYCFEEVPRPYLSVVFMNASRFGNHLWRLKTKLERSSPVLRRVIPFESRHVVGLVFLGKDDEVGNSGVVYLTSLDRQTSQLLVFMHLPENSSDILEPIWQVLAGYQFNFETCPGDEEIRKLIEESDIPEISITAASYPEMQKE